VLVYPISRRANLRAISELGRQPSASAPGVPTLEVPGLDAVSISLGRLVHDGRRAGANSRSKMRELIGKVGADPLFKQSLENVKVVPDYRDAPEFKKFFRRRPPAPGGRVKSDGPYRRTQRSSAALFISAPVNCSASSLKSATIRSG